MSERITYGNWFEKKSPGVFKLTAVGTVGLGFGVLAIVLASQTGNFAAVAVVIVALVAFETLCGWEYDGKTLARRLAERRDHPQRAKRGETTYITGVMSNLAGHEGGHPMPGVLAQTKLLRGIDGYGQEFDVIHYPNKGLFAVTFRCQPDGRGMDDQDLIDMMVAQYGAWLATLSVEEGVVGATVIIDAAPGTGVELKESVLAERAANAPTVASRIMDTLVTDLPNHSSDITGYVTVVWKRTAMVSTGGTPEDVVVEIAKRLPSHAASLEAGGAGSPIPMTEADLVEMAQVAYDPEVSVAYDLLRAREQSVELGWADAGPSFLTERRPAVMLPGGAAETLEMRRPPRGVVFDNHLLRLLQPNSAFLRKRVAIFYQAVNAEKAQSQAENAVRSEDFTAAQQKGRRTATTRRGIKVAEKLDAEIATGAALVPFAMAGTVTYDDAQESERRARNAILGLMTSSRMKVRRSKGLQAALFHMTLPFGILPWEFTDYAFKK
jgi:hypothetical protein